jgi:hypothetical protein
MSESTPRLKPKAITIGTGGERKQLETAAA